MGNLTPEASQIIVNQAMEISQLKDRVAELEKEQVTERITIAKNAITEAAACAESFQIDGTLAITYESLIEFAENWGKS